MKLNINKLKSRLDAMTSNKGANRDIMWKPTGKHVIRIVPYAHDPSCPFVELLFHYGLNGKNYLSPASFERPDPVVELSSKLKKTGSKDDYKMARTLDPKMRVYVPIVIRGEEDEGVKFWGFGKQVYEELLGFITDPDYGDITDPVTGRDISVEFKSKDETGKDFPETTIRVKPNQSPAVDISNKSLMEKLKNQKNLTEVFKEPTYEELSEALEKWLKSGQPQEEGETAEAGTSESSTESTKETVKEEVSSKKTETPTKEKKVASAKEVSDAFDDLFKK